MHPRGAAVLSIPAKHPAVGEQETLASYWTFYWAVAAAQLSRWLPRRPSRVLDLAPAHRRRVRIVASRLAAALSAIAPAQVFLAAAGSP